MVSGKHYCCLVFSFSTPENRCSNRNLTSMTSSVNDFFIARSHYMT